MFSFFYNATATTEIYTLSLHDALPICHLFPQRQVGRRVGGRVVVADELELPQRLDRRRRGLIDGPERRDERSEEHTSELQSRRDLVCRLLLEKKKSNNSY